MIEMKNVSFSYGSNPFIQNLDLTIHGKMVTGLVGLNGSGKSTVLKLAAGILAAKKGGVLLNGREIGAIRPKERAKQVALLHQGARIPHLRAWDVVLASRYPYRSPLGYTAEDREVARRSMQHTGCAAYKNKRMDHLSGGERQKVFMAGALAQQTDVLLLDEPTAYLDVSSAISWMQFIRDINGSHSKTVVAVLHDLNLALHYCDELILLAGGSVMAQGSPTELVDSGTLTDALQVQIQVFERDAQRYYCYQ